MLHCARSGVETHVICLTPGQAASHRGGANSPAELAAIRRAEFAASCHILEVNHAEILDYEDAGLYRTDLLSVVQTLSAKIRSIRPHVMITLGPEGAVTAHPDHSMASLFATMAFHWAGRESFFPEQLGHGVVPHRTQKLYYGTAQSAIPGRGPVSLAPITLSIDIAPFLTAKLAAFKAHETQGPIYPIFEQNVLRQGGKEHFHLAATITPGLARPEKNLFDGVSE